MSLEKRIIKHLIKTHKTLATAESCTGGLISHSLTNIPGSSDVFKAGLVTYSNEAKHKFLKIPKALIDKKGAVSRDVAKAMAKGVRTVNATNYGLGTTGIAGPSGGSARKPIGLVFIAASSKKKILCKRFLFKGTRLNIKRQTAQAALELLYTLCS